MISELDGLSKGSKEGQYDSFEHADKVKRNAKATVEYLEKEFEGQNSLLRAITNQGSVMNTIAFRSEELAPGVRNFVNIRLVFRTYYIVNLLKQKLYLSCLSSIFTMIILCNCNVRSIGLS